MYFCASTNFLEALNAVKFLGWHKIFGPALNILGPVKGQGIRLWVFFRTVPDSTKNAINLNKLAKLVGENDEDLDLDLLAKKLKEFDDDITETHIKRINSLKNRSVINMTACGMERSQSLKGDFILTIFNFG